MLLYYIRHGDPIYEPDSLSALGHEQAQALAKRLVLYGLDEIYSSSSVRAIQTAQPICHLLKKEMKLCEWAHEDNAWKNYTVEYPDGSRRWAFRDEKTVRMFNSPEVKALGEEWYMHPCFIDTNLKNGVNKTNAAVDEFLLKLGYKHVRKNGFYEVIKKNERRIALFAHQGMGLAFLSSLLDIPYPIFCTHFDLGHSSVTAIHFSDESKCVIPKVLQLSNDSHLYREGILTGYQNEINV